MFLFPTVFLACTYVRWNPANRLDFTFVKNKILHLTIQSVFFIFLWNIYRQWLLNHDIFYAKKLSTVHSSTQWKNKIVLLALRAKLLWHCQGVSPVLLVVTLPGEIFIRFRFAVRRCCTFFSKNQLSSVHSSTHWQTGEDSVRFLPSRALQVAENTELFTRSYKFAKENKT